MAHFLPLKLAVDACFYRNFLVKWKADQVTKPAGEYDALFDAILPRKGIG